MSPASFTHSSVEKAQRELAPAPIDPDWILEGRPQARYAPLSRMTDGRTWVDLWDCTAGRFYWHYACDETAHILEGEAVITDGDGKVWKVAAGDVVTFRQGSRAHWQVPTYVRKLAVMHRPLRPPVQAVVRLRDRMRNLARRLGRRVGFGTQGGAVIVVFDLTDWVPLLAL